MINHKPNFCKIVILVTSICFVHLFDVSSSYAKKNDVTHDSVRCNLATVYKILPNKKAKVMEQPNSRSKILKNLQEGAIVYVCGGDAVWAHIYFSGTEAPCFRAYDGGLIAKDARKCSSGWMKQKWVNILSG